MNLKPHQIAAHTAIFDKLATGVDSMLCALPTGTGKTFLAVAVSRSFKRTLFICHREELVRQTAETLSRVYPDVPVGFIRPGQHDVNASFVIGMVQTIHRRLGKIDPAVFDLVVIDEAHHSTAKTWRAVAEHFKPRLRLGLSATPERLDGSNLSHLFSEIAFEMSVADAVGSGYLIKPIARQCLTSCSLAGVRTVAGDLNDSDLAVAIDVPERNQFIVDKYLEHAPGRRAIAFAVNIDHSRNIAEAFNAVGVSADFIAGDSPDRAEKLARFASGEIQVLSSCMVLTEGFDDPGVACVLLARPTKSRPLFAQMIGRGLRLADGKSDCVVLDFTDNAGRHSLASAWRFLGYTKQPSGDEPIIIGGEKRPRESKIAAIDLERTIDLLQPPELPTFAGNWQYEPATEKQLGFLTRLGYDVLENDYSKGQAASIISTSPVNPWHLKKLEALGYDVSQSWNRGQYDAAINASKASALSAIEKMKRAGFQIELLRHGVRVTPLDRLKAVQADWVKRNQAGLRLALMS